MRRLLLTIFLLVPFLLASCQQSQPSKNVDKVGLLVSDTINDKVWGSKGYKGLLQIQENLNVEVYYKEKVNSSKKVENAVKQFTEQGVNLIFGHGSEFSTTFKNIKDRYPDVHFICFNSDVPEDENITSLNFKSGAMGYFAGMVSAQMTTSKKVGVIAAFPWQPEAQGFANGARFEDEEVIVEIRYVKDWYNTEKALEILDEMTESGFDVIYPAGDSFSVPIIRKVKEKGLYAIGFVSEQSDLGKETVLTSTVQHIADVYELVARQYDRGELNTGKVSLDFQDGVISMGEFSPSIPEDFRKNLEKHIDHYVQTGELPHMNKTIQ